MDFIVSQTKLAELFQCSTKTIRNFASQGMPRLSDGQYDIRKCTPWLLKQKQQPNRKAGTGDAYLELLKEQTESYRLKTDELRESLLERTESVDAFEEMKAIGIRNLEASLERLAAQPRFADPEKFAPIRAEYEDAIASIAAQSFDTYIDPDDRVND